MGGKRGRKPTGKVALPLRVDPEIRAFLERQVKRPHLSLSAVAEYYLSAAISTAKTKKDDDQSTHDFCNLVCEIVRISRLVERKRGAVQFNWSANYFDFLAFRLAVTRVLDRLAPPGVPSSIQRCAIARAPRRDCGYDGVFTVQRRRQQAPGDG